MDFLKIPNMGASMKQTQFLYLRSSFSVSLVLMEIKVNDVVGNSFWIRYSHFALPISVRKLLIKA